MSLRNDYERLRRLLEVSAYAVYKATLIGNPPPFIEALGKEIANPHVGDLVMEVSTFGARVRNGRGIGRLLRIEERPVTSPEEWAAGGGKPDEPIPTHRCYVIAPLDDDGPPEVAWEDATFIKVLERLDSRP